MSSPGVTLIGLTLVLAGLLGILVVAVIRLRGDRRQGAARSRVSEEAFMATAIQEVLAGRDAATAAQTQGRQAPSAQEHASIDAAILASLPIGIVVVRQGGVVVRANAAAWRLLHRAPPVLPARLSEITLPGALQQALAPAFDSPVEETLRLELEGPDGGTRTIEAALSRMSADGGPGARVLIVLTDLTERERGAAVARRRASMADTARLASSLAHELANSLTGVHGYARMIDPSTLSAADRASLEALQKETDTLSETIEGFRRVTRPLELTRERFPLRWLVEDAARHVTAELQVAADTVTTRTPEGLEVEGDRILLEDALMHIVRNAIEACTDAGIRPEVHVSAHSTARGAAVAVRVEDNGPGAAPAERARLGDPFFSTKAGRPGLGLARARHIVRSHDGAIDVASGPERGLVVTMTLPISNSAQPT
jgi:two-component system sensor histidine kinase HydH